ncbi:MAG TPA: AmmeMemoRadiSam system protein B [Methylomirabilota bacterium]
MEHEGRRFLVLRDPAGYASSVLMLPWPLVEIVALFDGHRSLLDVQAELTRRHGQIIPRADIERLIAALDEHGFLDGPRFAELRTAIDGAFLTAPTRAAAHAGGAYSAKADELRAAMDSFFAPPAGPGAVVAREPVGDGVAAIVAPHIDYHRGGPAYAWAYRDIAEHCRADLFVILGTCHAGMADPFALTFKDYETPLGPAAVDRDFVERLSARAGKEGFASEGAHRAEHSIEFQAVFLRYLYAQRRDFTIVPILASFAHEALVRSQDVEQDAAVPRFLDGLTETIATSGRRVALIAGADLAHVGPRFGDPAPVSAADRERVEREDRLMLNAVVSGDARGFFESVARDGDRRRICGLSPIYAVLRVLGGRAGALRHYGQWPDPQGVVSYASVVF